VSTADMPVSWVEWVDPATLRANDYNPNHVAPPEMTLLRLSIIHDGWTQPIVTRTPDPDGIAEIVDGFHRWTLAMYDPDVRAVADGLVPVVRLRSTSPASQRMSTIRHNRARGTHAVVKMADIVGDLADGMGQSREDIEEGLGMEPEEVTRLLERGKMTLAAGAEWSRGWVPGTMAEKAALLAAEDGEGEGEE